MLRAPSLADWFEGYAAELEAGEYVFEARTGRLTRRNPEAERKAAEAAKRAVEHARIRREMALVDQMHLAIADKDEARCLQVLEDARARNEAASFDGAVAVLFAAKPGPAFVAGIVRPFLRELVLRPAQWLDIAIGGVLMTNNAIRDIALGHRKDLSIDEVRKLAAGVGRTA